MSGGCCRGIRAAAANVIGGIATVLLCAAAPVFGSSEIAFSADVGPLTTETTTVAPRPEWYGGPRSRCEALPDLTPSRTILLLPARTSEKDAGSLQAFREALESYLVSNVRMVAPPHYDPVLLEGADALVVLGNGAFGDVAAVSRALSDADDRGVPIAWVGPGADRFADELGLRFRAGLQAPQRGEVEEIAYNGVAMATDTLAFAPPLAAEMARQGEVRAWDPALESPVILNREDLAYVGFLPFVDNYGTLPFVATIDSVARLFGARAVDRRVLFRLEDISATAYGPDAPEFADVTDFLLQREVFMHLGIIAEDVDHDPDLREERVLRDIGAARNVVTLAFSHPDAVEIVQHGFRHFRPDERNAGCGIPGCGWEFFEDDEETLGVEAAVAFARERLTAGREVIAQHLSVPMVYEAPHYTMTPAQAAVAEEMFPLILHEPWSYGSERGAFFLPWFTRRASAWYGPSDVGYVAYDEPLSVDYILFRLDAIARILPDPVVIVFFHPFIRGAEGREDDLERLVTGIERLGYRFASACDELASAR